MWSDGVILLHGNTYTVRKIQELQRKFKWEIWSQPPYSPDLAPNLSSIHLSGTRFSSDSDIKTLAQSDIAMIPAGASALNLLPCGGNLGLPSCVLSPLNFVASVLKHPADKSTD
ncbi:hypothetical protein AVEN_56441-1 [Araneus ventricosus]|uniref:Tc1-like transposase DDE domain-containing protein n=1 Tax=Araneus ventricosus TaxID=182803 RepID=A0A4Y2RVK3_ARAVE|nr:hypothetical protein AVEN_56441-1 [Araneus ventricosus]